MDFKQAAAEMARIVNVAARQQDLVTLAVSIIHPLKQCFYSNEAAALCRYVQRNIRYTNDTYGEDIFRDPMLTVKLASGDCNNKAVLFASLAKGVGFPVRFVFLFSSPNPNLDTDYPVHVWAEVEVYKKERGYECWVPCESTPLPNASGRLAHTVPFGVSGKGGGARIVYDIDSQSVVPNA
jgi:transglutaminase-like putative cysteine protease